LNLWRFAWPGQIQVGLDGNGVPVSEGGGMQRVPENHSFPVAMARLDYTMFAPLPSTQKIQKIGAGKIRTFVL
jgi:hypothetical protein